SMVAGAVEALASRIACRNEPPPESLVLLTMNVESSRLHSRDSSSGLLLLRLGGDPAFLSRCRRDRSPVSDIPRPRARNMVPPALSRCAVPGCDALPGSELLGCNHPIDGDPSGISPSLLA